MTTQSEIIEMAIQAHYQSKTWIDIYRDETTAGIVRGYLEAFAKLVEAKEREFWIEQGKVDVEEAIRDEREACATIAIYGCLVPPDGGSPTEDERLLCEHIAHSIRARGDKA